MFRGKFARRAQPHDTSDIFRAGPQTFFLMPPDDERCDFSSCCARKGRPRLGGMEFMTRKRQHVDGDFLAINGYFPYGLYRVGMEEGPLRLDLFGELFDGKKNAGFVVRPHERNESVSVEKDPVKRFGVKHSLVINADFGKRHAVFF